MLVLIQQSARMGKAYVHACAHSLLSARGWESLVPSVNPTLHAQALANLQGTLDGACNGVAAQAARTSDAIAQVPAPLAASAKMWKQRCHPAGVSIALVVPCMSSSRS